MAKTIGVDFITFDSLIQEYGQPDIEPPEEARSLIADALASITRTGFEGTNAGALSNQYRQKNDPTKAVSRREYLKNRYCPFVQRTLEIRGNGDVVPCCMVQSSTTLPNIKNYTLQEIWHGYSEFRRDMLIGRFHDFCYTRCNYDLPIRFLGNLKPLKIRYGSHLKRSKITLWNP